MTFFIIFVAVAIMFIVCKIRPLRPREPGFKYVYVNDDGSTREISLKDQGLFSVSDPRLLPFIKSSYKSLDGWGSISGFIERRNVPSNIEILPEDPDYGSTDNPAFDLLDAHRAAGDLIESNADGSVTCIPNPKISPKERLELIQNWHLKNKRKSDKSA